MIEVSLLPTSLPLVPESERISKAVLPSRVKIQIKKNILKTKNDLKPESSSLLQTAFYNTPISDPQALTPISLSSESVPTFQEEKKIESHGSPLPSIPSLEVSEKVVKYSPLSEGEIFLAQPKYDENPKPLYPQEAREKGYQGEALLRVEVLLNGRVGQIEVKRSSGHAMLDRSALTAVKQWRFIPAKKGKNPVPLWVNIPIKFQLR